MGNLSSSSFFLGMKQTASNHNNNKQILFDIQSESIYNNKPNHAISVDLALRFSKDGNQCALSKFEGAGRDHHITQINADNSRLLCISGFLFSA
jgi:hypothetical protein